jgi:hypothetical protein
MSDESTPSIDRLNSFLRAEVSAVETYRDVAQRATGAVTRAALEDCAGSHALRAHYLREAIARLGGTPAAGSGVRGAFARCFGRGALALGGRTGVAALARGEDRGLRDYRDHVGRLDAPAKALVEGVLLPAQERTRRVIHDLTWALS